MLYYENYDLLTVVTPINVDQFHHLLVESNFDTRKTAKLVAGFTRGFAIGYQGDRNIRLTAPNLKLTVGSPTELWNKVMKEVKLKRFAGPFRSPPFQYFIQSPIGLVDKDGGSATRLIFHLSYPRLARDKKQRSVNANTPESLTSVNYPDFDQAVRLCMLAGIGCHISKSDLKSAFRNLGIRLEDFMLLVMKAVSPLDGHTYYFVDKCLPFGAAISCALFQEFSDALAHIVRFKNHNKDLINYLDDYFFAEYLKELCNQQVQTFLDICNQISFPVSPEKTVWGTTQLVFLGILIDTVRQLVFVPADKVDKARNLISELLQQKRTTVKMIQRLAGLLNFFGRCLIPARVFTRRLYALTANIAGQTALPRENLTRGQGRSTHVAVIFKGPDHLLPPFRRLSD